jgi:F-type H+-transporting ATPase subunit delta
MSSKQARVEAYSRAVQQVMVERWQSELNRVASAIAENNKVSALLSDAAAPQSAKVSALDTVMPSDLSVEIANFVRLLVQEGDVALLTQVGAHLGQMASGRSGPSQAEVVSAVELTTDEQNEIRKKLTETHGEGLTFNFSVDPSLMGGLRVRVGDKLVDTSVATRLARLSDSFASAVQ